MGKDSTTHRPWPRKALAPADRTAVLTVLNGSLRGRSIPLRQGENVIGRGAHVEARVDVTGVSREHAKIVWTPPGVFNLFDLRSTNGTAVNGSLVDVAVLRPGDRIGLGPEVELRFGFETPELGAEDREETARRLRRLLSARQMQVARLVAEGLSNREVAEHLTIRVRTVESHLDNIYAQLGINSRTALTRTIVEAGLLARSA